MSVASSAVLAVGKSVTGSYALSKISNGTNSVGTGQTLSKKRK